MEMIVALAVKFWQWTVLIAVVLVAAWINWTDKRAKTKLKFYYKGMPTLQPVQIADKRQRFLERYCDVVTFNKELGSDRDWKYNIDGTEYVIPAGFQFDGASIPKFLRSFFSPVGVLLIGGLVHDYAYKYKTLLKKNKKDTMGELTQKRADEIFRDINIIVNGFYTMNRLAYWSLRIGGFCCMERSQKKKR